MAATAVDLNLTDAEAKKVVKLAIEHGAYSDDMPDTKKGRLEAAAEAVEFCVDSWVNDGVRPDDEDEEIAAAGDAIMLIFEAAGIEVDDEGNLSVGEEGEEEEPEEDDGEAPFDPDDYFDDGYTELTAASKIKALDELDLEDEDTLAIIGRIKEWEEEQDKPSSRVLSWIEDNVEVEEDDDAEEEAEGEEDEEPWEGYNEATAVDIKKTLDEAAADEDEPLTAEQLEYVKAYEEARKAPRKRILDKVEELIEGLAEAEEEDTKPAKKALGKKAAPAKKAAAEAESNGMLTVSINGEEAMEFDAASLLDLVSQIANELDNGATAINIEVG